MPLSKCPNGVVYCCLQLLYGRLQLLTFVQRERMFCHRCAASVGQYQRVAGQAGYLLSVPALLVSAVASAHDYMPFI